MHDVDRERSMPVFILISMAVHALLFLFAPQVITGLIPGWRPGDQGGVTYISFVSSDPVTQARAAVDRSALQPQARPDPIARPEPHPQPERVAPPNPAPAQPQVEENRPTAVVETEVVAERPTDATRELVTPSVANTPQPADASQREELLSPVEEAPSEPDSNVADPVPVMTSERGTTTVPAPASTQSEATAAPADDGSPVSQGDPASPQERDAAPPDAGGPAESGSGAPEDVSSSAPGAEISAEPALPPTGLSMVQSFGGSIWPKNAVGLLSGIVTVEVAVVVDANGSVIAAVAIDESGIDYIDRYSEALAAQNIQYKPHDSTYEISVFVTYNSNESSVTYRAGDFIRVPPTLVD